ncbi:hypothetical protein PIB30_083876 [Stylosanthes scabra]|uniref:Uncharacterized protein n=1 Tax=Stylosanthes scabra TaxID=79078 RepID=A0ABU6UW38_9FABA|nr:hypothetical protein [Stylosanthes scabra]
MEDLEGGDYDLFPFVGLPLPAIPYFDLLDFPFDEAYGDEVWAHTLTPQKLRVRAPGEGIHEIRYKMNLYSPQFVARQFGFAQALPAPTYFNLEDQLVQYEIDHTDEFAQAIEVAEERAENYQRVSDLVRCCYCNSPDLPLARYCPLCGFHAPSYGFVFDKSRDDSQSPLRPLVKMRLTRENYPYSYKECFVPLSNRCGTYSYSTKSFDDWWSNYFSSHFPPLEQVLVNMGLHSVIQSAPMSKNTKGKHIDEILSFEKFYKVKWNVKLFRPTIHSALEVSKRKKAAHEDRCFKNYLKAKTIDPLVCREHFMKPFKYLLFPNAQFGNADRLPDPVKGPLSLDYITNPLSPHLCRVTSTPYEWCLEMDHLIFGYTRIEGYPPGANPIIITGTTSDPQKSVEQ